MSAALTRRTALAQMAAASAATLAGLSAAHAADQGETRAAKKRPKLIAFDVIETLFDPSPIDAALSGLGLPAGSLKVWFPRFLRDAFALEVIGEYQPFREIATGSLKALCSSHGIDVRDAQIDGVLGQFAGLPAHPDVKPAFEAVHAAGVRMITLTNGSGDVTRKMLANAGLDGFIERSISIDEVRHWKPAREVYEFAAREMKVERSEMALVAAHDWDTAGASRAGLITGGVQRGAHFSPALTAPDVLHASILETVKALLALPK